MTEYPVTSNNCPSTHGQSGFPRGTVMSADGKIHCPLCGIEMELPAFMNGKLPDYITDKRVKKSVPRTQGFFARLLGRK